MVKIHRPRGWTRFLPLGRSLILAWAAAWLLVWVTFLEPRETTTVFLKALQSGNLHQAEVLCDPPALALLLEKEGLLQGLSPGVFPSQGPSGNPQILTANGFGSHWIVTCQLDQELYQVELVRLGLGLRIHRFGTIPEHLCPMATTNQK